MDKILFLNEKDRNTGLSLEHSDYRYKTAKPVAATKPKHDEVGFTIPYAMFRPIREPGLLCELLGDNPVRRCADLKMNLDFLMKEAYEHMIEQMMCSTRLNEIRCQMNMCKEDRAMEHYARMTEKGVSVDAPKVTTQEQRGDKIAQLVILPIVTPALKLVDKFAKTERGDNGFGSRGR